MSILMPRFGFCKEPLATPKRYMSNQTCGYKIIVSVRKIRTGFSDALEQIYVHECGGAFVANPGQSTCPYCQAKISIQQRSKGSTQLLFRHIDTGTISKFDLVDGQYLHIGRDNLKNTSAYVSSKHVRLMKQGKKLYLTHVGKNPTRITFASDSCTYRLKTGEIRIDDPKLNGAVFQLADSRFEVSVKK